MRGRLVLWARGESTVVRHGRLSGGAAEGGAGAAADAVAAR